MGLNKEMVFSLYNHPMKFLVAAGNFPSWPWKIISGAKILYKVACYIYRKEVRSYIADASSVGWELRIAGISSCIVRLLVTFGISFSISSGSNGSLKQPLKISSAEHIPKEIRSWIPMEDYSWLRVLGLYGGKELKVF